MYNIVSVSSVQQNESGVHIHIFTLFYYCYYYYFASLVAQLVKNPPEMRETWVRPLGWEDPLAKGKSSHSKILAWRIPWTI